MNPFLDFLLDIMVTRGSNHPEAIKERKRRSNIIPKSHMGDIGDYPGENPGDYIERGSYKGKDPVLDKNKRKLYSDTYKEKNKYARYYETETFFPRPDVERGPFNPNDFKYSIPKTKYYDL